MSDLLTRLQNDLIIARKAQNKPATLLLSTILSDVKNRRIELQRDLTDEDVREVFRRGIKRRRESVEMYDKAGRTDLRDRERDEIGVLEKYLPTSIGDDEIRGAVRAAIDGGAAHLGAVMSAVMPDLKGRADGSRINAIVREELTKQA